MITVTVWATVCPHVPRARSPSWSAKPPPNIGTIIICAVLVLIVAAIIFKLVRDKRKGKSSCGCNCAHCAMSGTCHGNIKKDK